MKKITLIFFIASSVFSFSSCQKCYECSKQGSNVVTVCDDRRTVKSDLSIYQTNGFTCVKK